VDFLSSSNVVSLGLGVSNHLKRQLLQMFISRWGSFAQASSRCSRGRDDVKRSAKGKQLRRCGRTVAAKLVRQGRGGAKQSGGSKSNDLGIACEEEMPGNESESMHLCRHNVPSKMIHECARCRPPFTQTHYW
jgi:hypothetical protein